MANAGDPWGLQRFIDAQEEVYEDALSEIKGGRKKNHWMWFIFPQLEGLGASETAQRYAIRNAGEAEAYLAHPILGARLRECVEAVLAVEGARAVDIFGSLNAVKLRSSATLFALVSPTGSPFHCLLSQCFGGEPDAKTLRRLGVPPSRI